VRHAQFSTRDVLFAMNNFPADYVQHNLPVVLLSGLQQDNPPESDPGGKARNFLQEGGFRVKIDIPVVGGDIGDRLLKAFLEHDASDVPWHGQALASANGKFFRFRSVGRVGQSLPPRPTIRRT